MPTATNEPRRFAIALSFPGEHRSFVAEVAGHLAARFGKERILYDKYYEAEFARPNLDVYLPGLYREQSELVVLFLCPDYAKKRWCNLEWRHIRDLLASPDEARIMFLRYGYDGDLTALGILRGDGTIDFEQRPARDIAALISQRLYLNRGEAEPDFPGKTEAAAVASRSNGPTDIHISGLPETGYERLVGRDAELQRLDAAWTDPAINILSLVAQGGAGKSALVNEWLKRLQAAGYRGAETVLGWSFYNQGSKERSSSADEFLNWALGKLGVDVPQAAGAATKGEAIAQALMRRRVLLLLDGVEPLQYGIGGQIGQLKDPGLRAVLRGFAATPPGPGHGLIVLTSRLAVADLKRWQDGAAPVLNVEHLSDAAGAALLRNGGVRGSEAALKEASQEFGGHPLALTLLASFLKETQGGDVRARSRIRAGVADADNPHHDHARRVMESYEAEWLAGQPVLRAILQLIGLFDRPASGDCVAALRAEPVIEGLTEAIVKLDETAWRRAVARLREVRLLAPLDPAAPATLDVHPLVREWFGERLRLGKSPAWTSAHRRLYEHLCASTKEGEAPELADLAPLYQAVFHGCLAGMQQDACDKVYLDRINRGEEYSNHILGAHGLNIGAIACFFDRPWTRVSPALSRPAQGWMLASAAMTLRTLGRLTDAVEPMLAGLAVHVEQQNWQIAAVDGGNLSELSLTLGRVDVPIEDAKQSVDYADRGGEQPQRLISRTVLADALVQAGREAEAGALFDAAEAMQAAHQPRFPLLYAVQGFRYCDLLLAAAERAAWRNLVELPDRAESSSLAESCRVVSERIAQSPQFLPLRLRIELDGLESRLSFALDLLTQGRANLYAALLDDKLRARIDPSRIALRHAMDQLRHSGRQDFLPHGLLSRAWLRALDGAWSGPDSAEADLDEAFEIAEFGPMPLHLADIHLSRARLFGLARNRPATYPWGSPQADLAAARRLIETCGYWRRRQELEDAEDAARQSA
jgi:TIR domain